MLFIVALSALTLCSGFVTPILQPKPPVFTARIPSQSSALFIAGAIIDVPDGFFTLTFPMLGIMLQISKQVHRARLEERAFDLRLQESRERRMEQNPSLVESELIRQDAAKDISYYGPDAIRRREEESTSTSRKRGPVRTILLERDGSSLQQRRYTLCDEEIQSLEALGVEYDPYYDDPYTEEELPTDGKFRQDKRYGDRIYENGEIFYRDSETGLFYRQGAKPRTVTFWAGGQK
jgi:hypothetical protein